MNSSKLIDMSLDDIIKLTKLEKRRQFRNKTPIVHKTKLNAKLQFRSPLNRGFLNKGQKNIGFPKWQGRKNFQELYKNKINRQQASEIKRIRFRKQQKQRNVAKIILQTRLQNLKKNTQSKQSKINHQYLGRNMLPFSIRKHIGKNLSIQKRNFLSEDNVLTISINNNLPRRPLQKEKLFRPRFPFDLPTSQMQTVWRSTIPQVSKPTGVKDLRPLVNQTTKTLNDRFTNHTGMRVVFS